MKDCDECRNYINLQTWTDKQGNKHTLRSERLIKIITSISSNGILQQNWKNCNKGVVEWLSSQNSNLE